MNGLTSFKSIMFSLNKRYEIGLTLPPPVCDFSFIRFCNFKRVADLTIIWIHDLVLFEKRSQRVF